MHASSLCLRQAACGSGADEFHPVPLEPRHGGQWAGLSRRVKREPDVTALEARHAVPLPLSPEQVSPSSARPAFRSRGRLDSPGAVVSWGSPLRPCLSFLVCAAGGALAPRLGGRGKVLSRIAGAQDGLQGSPSKSKESEPRHQNNKNLDVSGPGVGAPQIPQLLPLRPPPPLGPFAPHRAQWGWAASQPVESKVLVASASLPSEGPCNMRPPWEQAP